MNNKFSNATLDVLQVSRLFRVHSCAEQPDLSCFVLVAHKMRNNSAQCPNRGGNDCACRKLARQSKLVHRFRHVAMLISANAYGRVLANHVAVERDCRFLVGLERRPDGRQYD